MRTATTVKKRSGLFLNEFQARNLQRQISLGVFDDNNKLNTKSYPEELFEMGEKEIWREYNELCKRKYQWKLL